jgi:hypothetical protein
VAAALAVAPLPRQAVAAPDAVVQQPAALAVAVPRRVAVSGARPRPGAEVALGSLAEAVAAAGSPAAVVPEDAPAARRTVAAPQMAVCGWQCRAADREDGPADGRQRGLAAYSAQQPDWAQPNSVRRQAVWPARRPAACGWQSRDAVRHPVDGGNPERPATVSRCPALQCLEQRCLALRSSAQLRSA